MTNPPHPKPDKIRLTITVTPRVHEAFTRLSAAASISLGRAMGDWLSDTIDAAEFTAQKMEQARSAPGLVARELHAYALGLTDETGEFMRQISAKGVVDRAATGMRKRPPSGPSGQTPPSSNTGGKVPRVNPRSTGPKV